MGSIRAVATAEEPGQISLPHDMSINVKKSSCLRVGCRYNSLCSNLTTLDGREIVINPALAAKSNKPLLGKQIRYLAVYLVSPKALSCNYDLIKKVFYRAFNAIYGNVERLASVDVVIELFKTKCMPILLYGLDACPARCPDITPGHNPPRS